MSFKYGLEILAILAILGFCVVFLYTSSVMSGAEFAGADTKGSSLVSEITGKSEEEFQPLVWQWIPPSGEIEAGIFALQAAIGGIMVGWVFGYWKGQEKMKTRE
jgi:cobalt/nickel transport protein